MTVPQLLLVIEEHERARLRRILDQFEAVANGAGSMFDAGPAKEWRKRVSALLDKP